VVEARKYRHESYIASIVLATFLSQYDVVGSENYRFQWKTSQNGHNAVEGTSRSPFLFRLKADMQLPIND